MRWLLLVVLVLLGCDGCCVSSAVPPQLPSVSDIGFLRSSTVALVAVRANGTSYRPYCSGVWIGTSRVLTAHHCLEGVEPGDAIDVSSFSDVLQWGADATIVAAHRMRLVRKNESFDLALLEAVSIFTDHESVSVARYGSDGEYVTIVGHPVGYLWHVIGGRISTTRIEHMGNVSRLVWHVDSNVFFGSSGGGMFNTSGELLGITSFIDRSGPGHTFFSHLSDIQKFLVER